MDTVRKAVRELISVNVDFFYLPESWVTDSHKRRGKKMKMWLRQFSVLALTVVFTIAVLAAMLCSEVSAAPVLWVGDGDGTLGTVDVATGTATVVGQMPVTMTDIAFDPSGNLWGITFTQLYQINPTTAAATLVGNLGTSANSLVFGADGTLYTANSLLFTVNTSTGAASLIGGGGGYGSSGDLAFIGGNLYLSSVGDNLFAINTATGVGTLVGSIGFSSVFGLATDNNIDLYGITGTNVLGISTATGAGTILVNYAGTSLGGAFGSAFLSESGGDGGGGTVPEPSGLALLGLGLAGLATWRWKHAA